MLPAGNQSSQHKGLRRFQVTASCAAGLQVRLLPPCFESTVSPSWLGIVELGSDYIGLAALASCFQTNHRVVELRKAILNARPCRSAISNGSSGDTFDRFGASCRVQVAILKNSDGITVAYKL